MQIHLCGIRACHDEHFSIDRPHGSGDYLYLYTHTDARILQNGVDRPFPKHSFIIFDKGSPQHYYALPGGYCNDYLHFDLPPGASFQHAPYLLPLNTVIPMSPEASSQTLLEEIYQTFISMSVHKEQILSALTEAFFLKLSEAVSILTASELNSQYYDALQTLRQEIYRQPERPYTVSGLATVLGLSPSYFQKIYKDTFRISCYNDVIAAKLHHAKALLTNSNYTVKSIAAMCGYENDVHFMRQFKKSTGMTPTDYRLQGLSSSRS